MLCNNHLGHVILAATVFTLHASHPLIAVLTAGAVFLAIAPIRLPPVKFMGASS